jgi:hypothetical protein
MQSYTRNRTERPRIPSGDNQSAIAWPMGVTLDTDPPATLELKVGEKIFNGRARRNSHPRWVHRPSLKEAFGADARQWFFIGQTMGR